MGEEQMTVDKFIDEQRANEIKLGKFMGWDYITEQNEGSAYDYTCEGKKIELKQCWKSKVTKNHFLEFEQRSDFNSPWKPSGFTLSRREADVWVVANDKWIWLISINQMEKMLDEHEFPIAITESLKNGNRIGQYARGYLVPLSILEQYATCKMKSPITDPRNQNQNLVKSA